MKFMSKKGIEYSDKSWNPYSGCEMTGCALGKRCWAYNRALRLRGRFGYDAANPFKPTFHPDKLNIPLKRKKPTRFNACFMGDIAYCKKAYLKMILNVVNHSPQHIFYFLTKQPQLVKEMELTFPGNAWVGVTVNEQNECGRIFDLRDIDCANRWISFEPLFGMITPPLEKIDWIVIGSQTNPDVQPEKAWVNNLISMSVDWGIPLFIKPNIFGTNHIMELPEAIRKLHDE
jgi:protein gp37